MSKQDKANHNGDEIYFKDDSMQTIHQVAGELVMFEKAGLIVNRMPDLSLQDRLNTGELPLLTCIPDDRAMSMSDLLGNSVFCLPDYAVILAHTKEALTKLEIL